MGLFKRASKSKDTAQGGAPADLSTLLLQGEDAIDQLARAHVSWGLGSADRWGLDQRTGLITWSFPERTATAPAQILASFSPSSGSWLWAWANESVRPEMSRDARTVRDWAKEHGHHALAQPKIDADERTAATLAALGVRITRATGFYQGPGGDSVAVITFGLVTLAAADGSTSTFNINIG
ncbi:hypothetical protein OG897_31285 [Streptomyces sp. NBC_00237]|uniref:DUF6882 domain-containing protein n=1 Tax=Streptomyces sp. NBC_00237 TaxID=2975687 RepID=UPI0022537BAC|nr:DUF6882 domain-containing protein [Streptomyces sp. NBC_00237]MCX5205900.1 hypothetical protein [Streptomyces sp. NBC_00237]